MLSKLLDGGYGVLPQTVYDVPRPGVPNMGADADAGLPQAPPSSFGVGSHPNNINVTGSGYSPDEYQQFILGDPGYQALSSALRGNEQSFAARMRGAIQKAVLDSGYAIPEAGSFLDAGQSDQAAANPYSTAALSSQAHQQQMKAIQNQLAARGGYDSGELTYGIGNENSRFNQEDLRNRGSVLDYLNGLLGQQAQLQASDTSALGQELGNAAARQYALHPAGGSTTQANYDSSTGTYVDSYGNHYDVNGTLVSPYQGDPNARTNVPAPPAAPSNYAPPAPSYFGGPSDAGNLAQMIDRVPVQISYGGSSAGTLATQLQKLLSLPV